MTPAQDETALALEAAINFIGQTSEYKRGDTGASSIVNRLGVALRATPQTPDAVREVKSDLLRMDYINGLPQPFLARFCGDKTTWWPVNDFEVATGLMRIDVCGKLQVKSFGEVMEIRDGDGNAHDPDTFYNEATTAQSAGPQAEAACRALSAVVEFVGKQEPDKLPDELLYGMLGIETMCRHALALYAPSASAGPQAEAVKESLHYLWAIKVRLGLLYEMSTLDSRLLEQLSDEVDWVDAEIGRLRAHPQPQQAEGRGTVAGCAHQRGIEAD